MLIPGKALSIKIMTTTEPNLFWDTGPIVYSILNTHMLPGFFFFFNHHRTPNSKNSLERMILILPMKIPGTQQAVTKTGNL